MATIPHTNATGIVAPSRQFSPNRRLGVVGGVLVATVAAAAILVSTTFPKSAPTTLPAMSNSMGYWDHVPAVTTTLPAMSNSFGYYEHIQAASNALPAVSHPFGFHDRTSEIASPSLPAMSSSPGYLDYVQASSNPALITRPSSKVQPLEVLRYESATSASAQAQATPQSLEINRYTSMPQIRPPLHSVTEQH